jgi:hypothetical protein
MGRKLSTTDKGINTEFSRHLNQSVKASCVAETCVGKKKVIHAMGARLWISRA